VEKRALIVRQNSTNRVGISIGVERGIKVQYRRRGIFNHQRVGSIGQIRDGIEVGNLQRIRAGGRVGHGD